MERVLPFVEAISERFPERTVFTRFITPQRAEDMPGTRRHYSGTPVTPRGADISACCRYCSHLLQRLR